MKLIMAEALFFRAARPAYWLAVEFHVVISPVTRVGEMRHDKIRLGLYDGVEDILQGPAQQRVLLLLWREVIHKQRC